MTHRAPTARRLLVINPASGGGDHAERVRRLASDHGFDVRQTEGAGDAIQIARTADADIVAACGGDGTVHEVVCGLWQAGRLDRTVVAVVPAGTGNNFARNLGIRGIEHAFALIESGDVRAIDLGVTAAGEHGDEPTRRPFVNSCVGGLTADASARTSSERKRELGVLAYVLNTLRSAVEFDGLALRIDTEDDPAQSWEGEAVMILVGNARRFPAAGRTQANVEDGQFEVAILEERPAIDLAGETAVARLLGRDTPGLTRLRTPGLDVEVVGGDPVPFSLDGEFVTTDRLALATEPGVLSLVVGGDYLPDPDA